MLLIAAGASESVIAMALGIAQNTLRKYFADELMTGHAIKTAENLTRLEKAAKAGSVSAMRYLDSRFGLVPERRLRLGKKALAQREAEDIPPDWAELLH
jgi:hypothetical protein